MKPDARTRAGAALPRRSVLRRLGVGALAATLPLRIARHTRYWVTVGPA